jgi:hypothetical protein
MKTQTHCLRIICEINSQSLFFDPKNGGDIFLRNVG